MCIEFKYVNGAHCVVCLFQTFFKTNNGKKPLKFGFLLGIYCMLLVSIPSNPIQRNASLVLFISCLKFWNFVGRWKGFVWTLYTGKLFSGMMRVPANKPNAILNLATNVSISYATIVWYTFLFPLIIVYWVLFLCSYSSLYLACISLFM